MADGQPALRSVASALDVLECFSGAHELGVTEVAAKLGVAKSTAHRLLATLTARGLVVRGAGGKYRLGLRLYELGHLAVSRFDLREAALPVLEHIRNTTNETVHIAVPDGAEVVYVERMESYQGLRFSSRVGRRMPVHCTSSGKAIAAYDDRVAMARIRAGFPRLAARTICDAGMFLRALDDVRAKGYASNLEEAEVGLSSIAAPVFAPGGRVVAALSVAGPTPRIMGDDRLDRIVRLVKDGARRLGESIPPGSG